MRYILLILLLLFTCDTSSAGTGVEPKKLVLATSDWEPLIDRDLDDGGYFPAIVKAALKEAGYSVRIEWLAWDRALEMSKRGHFDGVVAAGQIHESPEFFHMSDSGIVEDYAYFSLKYLRITQNPIIQIHPPVIGVIKTSSIVEELRNNKKITIREEYHQHQNIQNLLDGDINAFVGGVRHIRNLLEKRFPEQQDQIVITRHLKKLRHHHIMISKKHPDSSKIVDDFNRGFMRALESGQIDKIRSKYGVKEYFLRQDSSD